MTTIAASLDEMVADSNVVLGAGLDYADKKKIVRIRDKIAGGAGFDFYIQQFFAMLRSGKIEPLVRRDIDMDAEELEFIGIVLDEKGIWVCDESMTIGLTGEKYYAIGSGGGYARAAMMAGAAPRDAVKIAAKLDTGTALPLVALKLKRTPHAPSVRRPAYRSV